MLRRLVVDVSKLDEFKHFEAALTRFAFREERVGSVHTRSNFPLCQPRFLADRNQLFEKPIVKSLMLCCPSFAGDARLRFLLFLHPSSVGNA